MSRSRKKNPYITDLGKYSYVDKRLAWKAVRNREDLTSGSMYRKAYNTYNICDYRFYCKKMGYKGYMK